MTLNPSFPFIHPALTQALLHYSSSECSSSDLFVSMYVCLYRCPLSYLKTQAQTSRNFQYTVSCVCGSIILRRQCNTLSPSGFVDDVTFAHNRPGEVNANRAYTQSEVTHQGAAPGAKSDVYDCLVVTAIVVVAVIRMQCMSVNRRLRRGLLRHGGDRE